jgi:hypothetical protein
LRLQEADFLLNLLSGLFPKALGPGRNLLALLTARTKATQKFRALAVAPVRIQEVAPTLVRRAVIVFRPGKRQ